MEPITQERTHVREEVPDTSVRRDQRVAAVRRYGLIGATLLVGAVGAVLWASNLPGVVAWLFGGFASLVAAVKLVSMVRRMRHGAWGLDVLAIVAIASTVAVGEYVASLIIVLMLAGGSALESYAQGNAMRELSALLDREPQFAHRYAASGEVEDIPAADVRPGDALLVRSGELVPVDGTLVSPSAAFDESSLTGESMPVARFAGDRVQSGSLNGNASARITATALAADSQYQSIIALVKDAASNRAPFVRLADRFALPFTVISLAIAGTAWIVSGDPVRFAEVMVLATPCPLLLAAPVAFIGGMSRAARSGIIVKGGAVLEQLAKVKTVVFDKTGTLTEGRPTIVRILPIAPIAESELLRLVASAEQSSSHVLAASIVASAKAAGLPLAAVQSSTEVAAAGVRADLGSTVVAVGTLAFVRSFDATAEPEVIDATELAIYVAVNGAFAGTIIATDPIRASSASTVRQLRSLGISDIVMLTGDALSTAKHVAGMAGITDVRADLLPAGKVAALASLPRRPVLMVGDGVNDSPVLAAADVGIAMGARGATAASEAAGAVILADDIAVTATAIQIGRDTVRIALHSTWLGIGLSVGLMVVAAFGVIPATLGAGVQELVDVATILNALRAVGRRSGDTGRVAKLRATATKDAHRNAGPSAL